jgi:hypothetical protein
LDNSHNTRIKPKSGSSRCRICSGGPPSPREDNRRVVGCCALQQHAGKFPPHEPDELNWITRTTTNNPPIIFTRRPPTGPTLASPTSSRPSSRIKPKSGSSRCRICSGGYKLQQHAGKFPPHEPDELNWITRTTTNNPPIIFTRRGRSARTNSTPARPRFRLDTRAHRAREEETFPHVVVICTRFTRVLNYRLTDLKRSTRTTTNNPPIIFTRRGRSARTNSTPARPRFRLDTREEETFPHVVVICTRFTRVLNYRLTDLKRSVVSRYQIVSDPQGR